MARQYQPKYYPQPKPGTGFTWIHPTTGNQHECKGVEWYLDFRDAKGNRQRRKVHDGYCTCPPRKKGVCPHEQLAIDALAAVITSPAPAEEVLEDAGRDLSIERFAAEHLLSIERSRTHADRSKQIIVLSIQTFLEFSRRNGIVDLDRIKRHDLEVYRDELSARKRPCGKPYKARTINRYLGDVRAMLNRAIERELITKNVANSRGRNDTLYLPEDDESPRTLLTKEELAVLNALTDEDLMPLFLKNYRIIREMYVMFYRTGMRLGELANLTFLQVRNGVIHIEPHDGWKPKWGIVRQIPVDVEVAKIISQRRSENSKAKYVFETSNGTRFEERNVREDFDTLFDAFGIVGDNGEGVSTHCLRHTFATTCLASGIPITTVADWLGHQNIEMTMAYYHRVRAMTDTQMAQVKFVG